MLGQAVDQGSNSLPYLPKILTKSIKMPSEEATATPVEVPAVVPVEDAPAPVVDDTPAVDLKRKAEDEPAAEEEEAAKEDAAPISKVRPHRWIWRGESVR